MSHRKPKLKVTPLILLVGVTEQSSCYYLFQLLLHDYYSSRLCHSLFVGVGSQVRVRLIHYIHHHSLSNLLRSGMILRPKRWGVGGLCLVVERDPFIGFEGNGSECPMNCFCQWEGRYENKDW